MFPSYDDLLYLKALQDEPDGRKEYSENKLEWQRITVLRSSGYLKYVPCSMLEMGTNYVQITVKGRDAVAEWERSQEAARLKALAQAEKEAKEEKERRLAQQHWQKDKQRSWSQFLLRVLFDIVIFLLGVYFGGTTKTFQWFIGFFQ